jgi:hypothetical protein
MRWDVLFADLEAQADAIERSERAIEIGELTRIEVGCLGLLERLRPALGTALRLRCAGGFATSGKLVRVAPEWGLIDEGQGRDSLLALGNVISIAGLGRLSAPPGAAGAVESRLGIRHALRAIAADRSVTQLCLSDGSALSGTVDRVGKDFLELSIHAPGEVRRRSDVREVQLVSFAGLVAVRRDSPL